MEQSGTRKTALSTFWTPRERDINYLSGLNSLICVRESAIEAPRLQDKTRGED